MLALFYCHSANVNEKMLLNLTTAKVMITLLLLYASEITATNQQQPKSINEKQVQAITNYMDMTADPCDDFFTYACGNWTSYHNTTRYTEATGLIDHKINKKFALLLENYTPDSGISKKKRAISAAEAEVFQKFWTYYKSCKREKSLEIKRYLQLVRPSERVNWPAMLHGDEIWPKERFSWFLTLAKLRRFGLKGVIVEHLVLPKSDNGDSYSIDLDKANAGNKLPARAEVVSVFMALGSTWKQANEKFHQIRKLQEEIFALLEIEDEYGLLEVTVQDLKDDVPQVPWRRYLANVLDRNDIEDDFGLQIRNWEYFSELVKLLEQTDPEVTCNYIMIMFLSHIVQDGTTRFEKINCIVDTRSKMDMAANYIYRQRFYRPEATKHEDEARVLLDRLRKQFLKLIHENRLQFSPEEIDFIVEKVQALRINFGNLPPEQLADTTKKTKTGAEYIMSYYGDLQLDPKNYYKNHLALLELRFKKEHQQLQHPNKGANYIFITDSDTARSSTPYYLMRQNVIIVPFGIFQPPMFHRNMHDLLKMSLFGFLMAHELVHGFDASGIAFNHHGNLMRTGVKMSENVQFLESVQCLQREETDSIDERIADVVGIRLAYDAYFGDAYMDPLTKLPFAGFNARRLFFLNMAQFFCGSMAAAFMDHDSDNVRLQQTLLHFEPFAEEFSCDLGDVMHPEEKCRLW